MDPRLLGFYNDELTYIRETAAEFSREYPRVARRLSLEGLGEGQACPDPYVERLLEGFAFLAARIQLKRHARYPELCHQLLEVLHPGFLAPLPSCTVLEFTPDPKAGSLQAGYRIPGGAFVDGQVTARAQAPCRFRTGHTVHLRPLEVAEIRYFAGAASLKSAGLPPLQGARAAVRIRLRTLGPFSLPLVPLGEFDFFVKAPPDVATRLYEQLLAQATESQMIAGRDGTSLAVLWKSGGPEPLGLRDDEALLPVTRDAFQGYRLLQEYFMLPERLQFLRIGTAQLTAAPATATHLDLLVGLDRVDPVLERQLDSSHLRLHCTPAINLFPRSLDRITLDPAQTEQQLVADRSRALDFEVHSVERVRLYGGGGRAGVEVPPVYRLPQGKDRGATGPYYTIQRRPRLEATQGRQGSARGRYVGTDTFVAVSRWRNNGQSVERAEIDIGALCTNRALPMGLGTNTVTSQFRLEGSAPVASVQCLVEPSIPRTAPVFNDGVAREGASWRFVSHLTLNHLALSGTASGDAAAFLREMLALYADGADVSLQKQVEGLTGVEYSPIVARIPGAGPITYGRGLAVTLNVDESCFEGLGAMPLATVLAQFLARLVSINAFVRTTLRSSTRGEIKVWPPRVGTLGLL
jgi:type VI secretion system protein ImpG